MQIIYICIKFMNVFLNYSNNKTINVAKKINNFTSLFSIIFYQQKLDKQNLKKEDNKSFDTTVTFLPPFLFKQFSNRVYRCEEHRRVRPSPGLEGHHPPPPTQSPFIFFICFKSVISVRIWDISPFFDCLRHSSRHNFIKLLKLMWSKHFS